MTIFFLFLLLASFGWAESQFSIFEIGEAPEKGVYDPLDWLEGEKRKELEENYQRAFEKWGVRVFVLILPEKPVLGLEVFAKKIGRNWGGKGTWGVLLHVVGDSESPWCAGERGESLRWAKQEEFDEALERAVSRAHRETDEDLSVRVGARELTDELGFLGIVSNRRDQLLGNSRGEGLQKARLKVTQREFVRRALMIAVPLVLILGTSGFLFLRAKARKRMTGFEFPETAPRRRFHGPWSGGGNVLISFSGRVSGDGSRRG